MINDFLEIMPDNDTDQTQLVSFTEEYQKSQPIKKVSLIINSLKIKNQLIRLFCASKLTEIGIILGNKRIDDELIPFITDLILNFEENEEVLCEFSNQLLNLLLILQKENIFSSIGVRSLEILSGNDDENVRQTSIKNLSKFIESLDEDIITGEIFPLMKRLIENDLKTKMSCCYLFPVVYPRLQNQEIKKELLQVYYEISHDESPSVRRVAADNIRYFCKVNDEEVINQLVKLYEDFIKDTIDIVKIYTIESTKDLLEKLQPDEKEKLIMNLTNCMSREKSWRVKYACSEIISKICVEFPENFNELKFVPILMLFLKDKEPEVRCSVLANFDIYLQHITLQKFKDSFIPIFEELSKDINLHVRSIYASCLLKCLPFLKEDENLVLDTIVPLLTKLLNDDVYEVQYAAIEHIDKLILLANHDENLMNKCIMPTITEGMKNTKWRFRNFIADNLLKVIEQLPKEKINKEFLSIIIKLFTDNAAEIRETSWKIIEKIVRNVDNTFLKNNIWNFQKDKLNSKNYIMRIASMNSINYLKKYYDINFLKNEIIKEIIEHGKIDKIANVKFTSCLVLKDIEKYLENEKKDDSKKNEIKEYVKSFENDKDPDVQFFSKKAYNELN